MALIHVVAQPSPTSSSELCHLPKPKLCTHLTQTHHPLLQPLGMYFLLSVAMTFTTLGTSGSGLSIFLFVISQLKLTVEHRELYSISWDKP